MKIGIITFQNAINLGAFLQGYALLKCIESYGMDAEFCYRLSLWKQKYDIVAKRPRKLKFNLKRYVKFYREQRKLPISKTKKYNILICGSDSIWDISEHSTGYLPEMFGNGYIAEKKLSYAASFGTMRNLKEFTPKMRGDLLEFAIITVRDENSRAMVWRMLNKEAKIVADPTLLYNYEKEEIDCKYKNYVMVYGDFPPIIRKQIQNFAKEKQKLLLSVGTYNTWCDRSIAVSPFEFLGFIHRADYVFTSMYHGSIFAMKYEKKFLSYFISKRWIKASTTFEYLGIEERRIDENSDIVRKMEQPLDYSLVNGRLKKFKEESLWTLKEILNVSMKTGEF